MTSITWAGPRCVQGLAAILGPQNRTQGRCEANIQKGNKKFHTQRLKCFTNICNSAA